MKLTTRHAVVLGAASLLIGSLPACNNKSIKTGGAASPAGSPTGQESAASISHTSLKLQIAEPAVPAAAVPSSRAKKAYKIAVSLGGLDHESNAALEQGLKAEAGLQNVEVMIGAPESDPVKQISDVQASIATKPDAIVLCPLNSSVSSVVIAANKARIPVFTAITASHGGKVACHITPDNAQGGRLVGDYLATTLLNGKGTVAILGQHSVASMRERSQGVKDALAAYPGITIVTDLDIAGEPRASASGQASRLLTSHPALSAVFGVNDQIALGALSSVQQMAKSNVAVVGFDAIQEARDDIASVGSLKATAMPFPRIIGQATVDAVVKYLNGEAVPAIIHVPCGLVTAPDFVKE